MSPITIGLIGIGVLLVAFIIRMPLAFAMAFVGFCGFVYLTTPEAGFSVLSRTIFEQFSSFPLSAIPLFILMGSYAYASGISSKLYQTAYTWIGQLRGGLTMATIVACSGFAAICGSSTATAATMGKIALPEMKKYNYSDTLAAGSVAAAGSLGILIPPSTIFIVYGIMTEQSIGKLFIAGVLPGILLSLLFILTVAFICRRNPAAGPQGDHTSWREKFASLTGVVDTIILFCGTIGGLFVGFFTPTQAGAVGAAGAIVIGLARRQLTWQGFLEASKDALRTACMVICIITGATIFGKFMAVSTLTFAAAGWVEGLPFPPLAIMGVIIIIYFVGGCFMDSMALIVLTLPVIFPIVQRLGFDPIWFGVIIVLVAEMGVITPPVGTNVFVIKGVAGDIPLETIFKGIFPFLVALLVCAAIIVAFPKISTFLPSLISY
mgnify:CR=1 FL=1